MSAADLKMSVVVPAYNAAKTLERLMRSIDAQTMPKDEFEVVVVDDGSTDGTLELLQTLQRDRPYLVPHRIDPSGWASRPRNVGTDLARGEYVLYMDSDDTLFPDALRRSHEYASEHGADILNPKESQTRQPAWGMSSFRENVPNLVGGAGIAGLVPMTPHKVFRREFLAEHGLRFEEAPAGGRILWEDVRLVMAAYRHARVVSVLADTPVYHWRSNAGSISKSYGPHTDEFWAQVEGLLAFIHETFPGEELRPSREAMLVQQYKSRVLGRFATFATKAPEDAAATAFAHLRAVQDRLLPLDLDERLGILDQSRALLAREGRLDLLLQLIAFDLATTGSTAATGTEWRDGLLHVSSRTTWTRKGASVLAARGDRIVRDLPSAVTAALPDSLVDVTDTLPGLTSAIWVRDTKAVITWAVPSTATTRFVTTRTGGRTIEVRSEAVVDPEHAAFGRPLERHDWELWSETGWIGGHAPQPAAVQRCAPCHGAARRHRRGAPERRRQARRRPRDAGAPRGRARAAIGRRSARGGAGTLPPAPRPRSERVLPAPRRADPHAHRPIRAGRPRRAARAPRLHRGGGVVRGGRRARRRPLPARPRARRRSRPVPDHHGRSRWPRADAPAVRRLDPRARRRGGAPPARRGAAEAPEGTPHLTQRRAAAAAGAPRAAAHHRAPPRRRGGVARQEGLVPRDVPRNVLRHVPPRRGSVFGPSWIESLYDAR